MNIVISVPGDDLSTYTNNIGQWIVDDVVTEPTGSEAPGASYLVAAAGTGKFSGYSDNITILNASQGWIFIPPESEMRAISKANNTEYQYLSGSWVTVEKPNTGATLFGRGPVSSISNDPDGTPTVGMRRLVGTSPTGAWTGYANQVAEYFSDGWHYSGAATDGQFVYVQDVRRAYTWQTSPGAWKERSGKSFRLSEFATVAAAVTFIAAFSAPRPELVWDEDAALAEDTDFDTVRFSGGILDLAGFTATGSFEGAKNAQCFDISNGGTLTPSAHNIFTPECFGYTASDYDVGTAAMLFLANPGLKCGKHIRGITYYINDTIPMLQNYDSATYNGAGFWIVEQNARFVQVTDNIPILAIRGESARIITPRLQYANAQPYTNYEAVACFVSPEPSGIGGVFDCPSVSIIARQNAVGFHVPNAISDTLASTASAGATSITVTHGQTNVDGAYWWSRQREIVITLDDATTYTARIGSVTGGSKDVLNFAPGFALPSQASSGKAVTAPVAGYFSADTFFDLRDSTLHGAQISGLGSPSVWRGRIYGSAFGSPENPFGTPEINGSIFLLKGRSGDTMQQLTIEHYTIVSGNGLEYYSLSSPGIANLHFANFGFENIRLKSGGAQYLMGGQVDQVTATGDIYAIDIAAMGADTGSNICWVMSFYSKNGTLAPAVYTGPYPFLYNIISDNNYLRGSRDTDAGKFVYVYTTNPHFGVNTGMSLRFSALNTSVRKLGTLIPDGCVGYAFDNYFDSSAHPMYMAPGSNYTVEKLLVQRVRAAKTAGIDAAAMSVYSDSGATTRISAGGADVALSSLVDETNVIDLGVVSGEATKARAATSQLYAKCGTTQGNGAAVSAGASGTRRYTGALYGNTVVLKFTSAHGLKNGWASITGAGGVSAVYNRTALIYVIDTTHIQYYGCSAGLEDPEAETADTGFSVSQIPTYSIFAMGRAAPMLTAF